MQAARHRHVGPSFGPQAEWGGFDWHDALHAGEAVPTRTIALQREERVYVWFGWVWAA